MNDIHNMLFNTYILYAVALGIWGAVMAGRNIPISGNFWGAVATGTILAAIILVVGVVMTLQGLRPERVVTYYLYMFWLVLMMPGLFSILRGRDDRNAAVAFSILAFFNAATAISMYERHIVSPWM
jgi:hypothetical protein